MKHTEDPGKKKKINPEQNRMRLELQGAEQAALTQQLMHEDVLKTWQKKKRLAWCSVEVGHGAGADAAIFCFKTRDKAHSIPPLRQNRKSLTNATNSGITGCLRPQCCSLLHLEGITQQPVNTH